MSLSSKLFIYHCPQSIFACCEISLQSPSAVFLSSSHNKNPYVLHISAGGTITIHSINLQNIKQLAARRFHPSEQDLFTYTYILLSSRSTNPGNKLRLLMIYAFLILFLCVNFVVRRMFSELRLEFFQPSTKIGSKYVRFKKLIQ